jgi:uncharacterized protein (TIGR00251 family)
MCPLTPQSTDETTVVFAVQVVPGAARDEIVGVEGKTLKVRVTAPPVKDKANKALVKLLAKTFRLRKNQVQIVSGHKARQKMIRVEGMDENAILGLPRQPQAKR